MAGFISVEPCIGVRLAVATAVQCNAGVVGSASAGIAWDSELFGIYIPSNATAGALTIAGMLDSAGAAQNLVMTGSTSVDFFWVPPAPVVNSRGAFVFTASIANLIWVFTRAYVGPERPNTPAIL